jgi:hypothetical protein
MPITVPAHQLLVLPFIRRRPWPLSGTALCLGTALPDLAFPIGGYWLNKHSHEVYGPAFMALTLGPLLYLWLERLLAPALRMATPGRLAPLFATRGPARGAREWLWVLFALLLGSYSHWFFDGFTHYWMWPARDLYPTTKIMLGSEVFYLSKTLQIGCSILGSLVVLEWCRRRLRRTTPAPAVGWARRLRLGILATLVGGLAGAALGLAVLGWPLGGRTTIFFLGVPVGCGGFVGATYAAWRALRSQAGVGARLERL